MANRTPSGDALVVQAEATRRPFDPEVTLFVDDSEASTEARRLLASAGEEARLVQASGPRVPTAVFGLAAYEGVAGIRALLRELQALQAAVQSAYARHQPGRAQRAAREQATASLGRD